MNRRQARATGAQSARRQAPRWAVRGERILEGKRLPPLRVKIRRLPYPARQYVLFRKDQSDVQ